MPLSPEQEVAMHERDARVIEYKSRGLTFRQIAALGIEGVGNASQAHKAFHRGMQQITAVATEDYRALENDKLDALERRANTMLTEEDASASTRINAMRFLLQVYQRRAALNGIDAPITVDSDQGISTVFVDTRLLTKTRRAEEITDGDHDGVYIDGEYTRGG